MGIQDFSWIKPRDAASFDVLGLGEISIDQVGVAGEIPAAGGKTDLLALTEQPGGTVATALLGCQKLGLRARLHGAIGGDAAGQAALRPLRAAGVDVAGVHAISDAATRRALILVDRGTGERRVFGYRDPRLRAAPGEKLSAESIRRARILLTDTSDPETAEWATEIAQEAGTAVILDADRPSPSAERLLEKVHFPVVSENFARALAGDGTVEGGLEALESRGAMFAVVTRGDRGALARCAGELLACPAFPVTVVDTTGAGDAFHAGFIWALLGGRHTPRDILRAASAMAALTCRGPGAQGGLVDVEELERFLSRFR